MRRYSPFPVARQLELRAGSNLRDPAGLADPVENRQIDAVMFRVTSVEDPRCPDRRQIHGVPVRLITGAESVSPDEARHLSMWDAYNVDRMYMAGIQIKVKNNTTDQDLHQKSIVSYSRGLGPAPGNDANGRLRLLELDQVL